MSEGRPVRIGLLWHSVNSGNLGVGALTESNLAILRAEAAALGLVPHFTVIGMRDAEPPYISGPDIALFPLDSRSLLSPSGYLARLGALDCVFDIGAGDSWADIYGWKRFGFLWLTKMFAALRSVPLVFSPQTIGPFTTQPWTAMAKLAMRRARAIVVRDPLSRDVAASMVPDARIIESVDVAFALPFDTAAPRAAGGPVRVGINISGLLFHGGYGRDNAFGLEIDYAALMRELIASLRARKDVQVSLFGHVIAPGLETDDDGRVCDLLAAEFPTVQRIADFASPSAAKTWIATQDFIVAGRMHACIAAYSAGVPVVPVAYSRKFTGLFEGVLNYRHGVPVKGLSTEAARAHIMTALDRRAALAAEIAEGNKKVDAALDRYRAEIRSLLGSLPR
jgi:colanic acid/amylovoran biosynthesis protein